MVELFRQLTRRLHGRESPKTYPLPSAEFQRTLCENFCSEDTAAIERAIAEHYEGVRVTVSFDPTAVRHAMSCRWSRSGTGRNGFTFPAFEPGHLLNTVVNRWLTLFGLFLEFNRADGRGGSVFINFNDAGIDPALAFCSNSLDHILIPDTDFLKTRGYAKAREHFARDFPPWDQRRSVVFWRGSSLGQKHPAISDMPRARLCQIAKATPNEWFDVGMVDIFDVSDSNADHLRAMKLIKDRVSWKELNTFRYHIDIDGNANSFAGLFMKLLSGGLVLKVASPDGYRQWYYDQLRPWENFVPIHSDLSDLVEVAAYYREHDELAQRIARDGRQLALSLTFETEFAGAIEAVKNAFAQI
jgi:hypothetical protein